MDSKQKKLYSYLNLESTKTTVNVEHVAKLFYIYLNLESTKTLQIAYLLDL